MFLSSIKDKIIERKQNSYGKMSRNDSSNYFELIRTDPGHRVITRNSVESAPLQTTEEKKVEVPNIRGMCFELFSTWDDNKNSFGLRGVELFNFKGEIVQIINVSAYDKNLEEISQDLRVLEDFIPTNSRNLIVKAKLPVKIYFSFLKREKISMIRIWNCSGDRLAA